MYAYDRLYLERARTNLGRMLEYAVYGMKYELDEFWNMFLKSPVSKLFGIGDSAVTVGRSGIELAMTVVGENKEHSTLAFFDKRSEEYWTGWALAYYQWMSGFSFSEIDEFINIGEVKKLYSPYHEMDIRQFCDRINEVYLEKRPETNLKRIRTASGLSQSRLARISGVPVRTLQQYEQRQKDINKARADYIINLAHALYCEPSALLEKSNARLEKYSEMMDK